jgi:hypothetical protein
MFVPLFDITVDPIVGQYHIPVLGASMKLIDGSDAEPEANWVDVELTVK